MKLLFDANLAPRLVALLKDVFPGSLHVRRIGALGMPDADIWDYARKHGFVIVSKDNDFYHMSMLLGAPPKVVWLRIGKA